MKWVCQWISVGIGGLALLTGWQEPGWGYSSNVTEFAAHRSSPAVLAPTKDVGAIASPRVAPSRQRVLRLRRGPYFPSPEAFALPFPEPTLPEIVYPLHLVIRLSHRRVYVYQGDAVTVSYPIAVGKPGWETPVGEYTIISMQEDPVWRNPFTGDIIPAGANNPLGDRWIGFWTDGNNTIGFHGTPNEASVGRAASHGCVRMLNRDVRSLYAIVELGVRVTVEP